VRSCSDVIAAAAAKAAERCRAAGFVRGMPLRTTLACIFYVMRKAHTAATFPHADAAACSPPRFHSVLANLARATCCAKVLIQRSGDHHVLSALLHAHMTRRTSNSFAEVPISVCSDVDTRACAASISPRHWKSDHHNIDTYPAHPLTIGRCRQHAGSVRGDHNHEITCILYERCTAQSRRRPAMERVGRSASSWAKKPWWV